MRKAENHISRRDAEKGESIRTRINAGSLKMGMGGSDVTEQTSLLSNIPIPPPPMLRHRGPASRVILSEHTDKAASLKDHQQSFNMRCLNNSIVLNPSAARIQRRSIRMGQRIRRRGRSLPFDAALREPQGPEHSRRTHGPE